MKFEVIQALQTIVSTERRMAAIYRRAASMITGPYREALSSELQDHASDEDEHYAIASKHLTALGGQVNSSMDALPVWHNLDDLLSVIEELEEAGIKKWNNLLSLLEKDDAFIHTVESVLETEQDHWDDVKVWRRKDYSEMSKKSIGDLGSPRPLNYKEPSFSEKPISKSTWPQKIEQYNRYGTPPAKWGAFNGSKSGLEPGIPESMNPPLTLNKAVIVPPKVGPGGTTAQKPRKRDDHGKFATSQLGGAQTTAQDDKERQDRQAKLRSAKQKQSLNPSILAGTRLGMTKPVKKAVSDTDPAMTQGSQKMPPNNGNTIGQTASGMPIYDDPYHTEHEGLTSDDHQQAAGLHDQASQEAMAGGNPKEAYMRQQKASIHRDLANDQQMPADRMMQNMGMDKLDQFLKPQHQQDQNKPLLGQNGQGPSPGMYNTNTNSPVGMQTEQNGHANMVPQQQGMPNQPAQGSMPEISQQNPAQQSPPQQYDFSGINQLFSQNQPNQNQSPDQGQSQFGQQQAQQMPESSMPQDRQEDQQVSSDPQEKPEHLQGLSQFAKPAENPEKEGKNPFAKQSADANQEAEELSEDKSPNESPYGGNPTEKKAEKESNKMYTKSLTGWLNKRR